MEEAAEEELKVDFSNLVENYQEYLEQKKALDPEKMDVDKEAQIE